MDPKTKSKYRYLVSENRQNYYLEVELENWSKYILTNYGNALALNSAPNAPKTPWNPGGTTTPPPATPQTQDKDKYHPIWQTINAIVKSIFQILAKYPAGIIATSDGNGKKLDSKTIIKNIQV